MPIIKDGMLAIFYNNLFILTVCFNLVLSYLSLPSILNIRLAKSMPIGQGSLYYSLYFKD